MILIISENDQIIGADEEFLGLDSLENLKLTFPSMDIFTLQSSEGEFEFEYNNENYIVDKQSVILDNQNANIYYFKNPSMQNSLSQKGSSNLDELAKNGSFFNTTSNSVTNNIDELDLSDNTPSSDLGLETEPDTSSTQNSSTSSGLGLEIDLNTPSDLGLETEHHNTINKKKTTDIGLRL